MCGITVWSCWKCSEFVGPHVQDLASLLVDSDQEVAVGPLADSDFVVILFFYFAYHKGFLCVVVGFAATLHGLPLADSDVGGFIDNSVGEREIYWIFRCRTFLDKPLIGKFSILHFLVLGGDAVCALHLAVETVEVFVVFVSANWELSRVFLIATLANLSINLSRELSRVCLFLIVTLASLSINLSIPFFASTARCQVKAAGAALLFIYSFGYSCICEDLLAVFAMRIVFAKVCLLDFSFCLYFVCISIFLFYLCVLG